MSGWLFGLGIGSCYTAPTIDALARTSRDLELAWLRVEDCHNGSLRYQSSKLRDKRYAYKEFIPQKPLSRPTEKQLLS